MEEEAGVAIGTTKDRKNPQDDKDEYSNKGTMAVFGEGETVISDQFRRYYDIHEIKIGGYKHQDK